MWIASVALNRLPCRLEFSETLLGIHATFDGSMILFENVVQVQRMMPGSVFRHLKIAGRVIISRFFHATSQPP